MIDRRWIFSALVAMVWLVPAARGQAVHVPLKGTALDVDVAGHLFVLDKDRGTLTMYDASLTVMATAGGPGWEGGSFDQPAGIWARNGLDIFVTDHGNHRIQRFDRTLTYVSSLSTRSGDDAATSFGYPTDVTVSRFGALYICDTENNRIVRVDAANTVQGSFGGIGAGAGRLDHPLQVTVGPDDQVFVLDPPRVMVYDLVGNFLTVLSDGVVRSPARLAGDERGIVVADGADLTFINALHRPTGRLPLAEATGLATPEVLGLCLNGGKLYILTPGMLHIIPDPRGAGADGLLDKEPDNH